MKPTTENVIVEPSMEIEKTIHDFAAIWSTKDLYESSEMMPQGERSASDAQLSARAEYARQRKAISTS